MSETENKRLAEADELLELAWGVIANANGGDWAGETDVWREAAEAWRDRWLKFIKRPPEESSDGE